MKRIILIVTIGLIGLILYGQDITTINQNVYGSQVKDAINANDVALKAAILAIEGIDDIADVGDTLDAHNTRINTNVDAIEVNQGTINANTARINLNLDSLYAHDDRLKNIENDTTIWNTMLQDSLGWFIIDAATYGDSATDATAHIQSKIDAAEAVLGKVIIPQGNYFLQDSLYITNLITIEGSGRAGGTRLIPRRNHPAIYIDNPDGSGSYAYGAKIENLEIKGLNDADSSNQHGIVVEGQRNWDFNNLLIYQMGGHGIYLDTTRHNGSINLLNSTIKQCHLDGIYGRDRTDDGESLNEILIFNCHINDMKRHGISVIGNNTNILASVVEHCDSSGVFLYAWDTPNYTCNSKGTNIKDTYFEYNKGGDIFAGYYNDGGSITHYHYNLTIDGNVFFESDGYDNAKATAFITLYEDGGTSSSLNGFSNIHIGDNYYSNTTVAKVDANDILYSNSYIKLSGSSISSNFVNLGTAVTEFEGVLTSPRKNVYITDAGVGITEANLSGTIYTVPNAAIDITANPQIAPGWISGQTIDIINHSDTNTLTFDDGTGLSIGGSITLGQHDVLRLKWVHGENVWVKIGYEDN